MSHQTRLTNYIGAFVDELICSGVSDVVISPGSRSTPIAMMIAEHTNMKVWLNLDERSASFFALGMARAESRPVALLCTSGTAVANYFPAIIEAHYSRIPLIVITADRPHELRDVGSPQAIDQIKIFGDYVKWFVDMPLPQEDDQSLQYVRTVAGRAVAVSNTLPSAPVHLNFPLQSPLIPDLTMSDLWNGGKNQENVQHVRMVEGKNHVDVEYARQLIGELIEQRRGLIVVGPQTDPNLGQAVTELAAQLGYPILADPLSQLRTGVHDKTWIIDSYDAFLRDDSFLRNLDPQVIIRIGAMPVSKAFLLFLKQLSTVRYIVVEDGFGWREPTQLVTEMVYADPATLCQQLSAECGLIQENPWGDMWTRVNMLTKETIQKRLNKEEPFEGQIFAELQAVLPERATLFVGNSMPVRDLDSFYFNNYQNHKIVANRGANGIDGVISTALGTAAVSSEPVILVIGDLSFYHDMNGLMAAKMHHINLKIILVNNNGGGIFSFLPQANLPQHFEDLFGTPTELDFSLATSLYNGQHYKASGWKDFRETVKIRLMEPGLDVIEIVTNRKENTDIHRGIWDDVSLAIKSEDENVY